MTTLGADFFANNRTRFMQQLAGGVAVLSAYTSMQRGNDAAFLFEQEANFWWLTGIDSPDWWLIIDAGRQKCWLVSPTVSPAHEIFDGSLSEDAAVLCSGIATIITQDAAHDLLRQMAKSHSVIGVIGEPAHAEYFDFVLNPAGKKLVETASRLFGAVDDIRSTLARLRAVKQPQEITAIKQAIKLTVDAFEAIKGSLASYSHEYQVEAAFSHYFRSRGAAGHAYDPIVAIGMNACTLHYTANESKLKKNELLLLDIGARYQGYAADITRTYSLGRSTKRQMQVHGAVVQAQQQIIELLGPNLSVKEYHERVDVIMKKAIVQLGLMKDENDDNAYRRYFPHAISHGLGVDVHDSLGAPTMFEPGMVLTVEPGIYIPEEGIGVRIEDDILITKTGYENLTGALSTDL